MPRTEFHECDKLEGRMRAICRGEVELPLEGHNSINAYRVSFGVSRLAPEDLKIPEKIWPPRAQQPPTVNTQKIVVTAEPYKATRWVGTNLAYLLKKFGVEVVTGCGGCDQWMNDMNVWGPQGCRDRFAEIRERLQTKAKELQANAGRVKILKIGMSMLVKAQWPSIDALIKKAIKQAEKALRQ